MTAFQLSLIQMRVEGGNKSANLDHAVRLVDQAARAGAQVILLPETMDLGWIHPAARTEAEAIPDGGTCRRLCELAREHRVYLCSGLTERSDGRVFNAAVFINPSGEVLLHHRKLNELEIAHDYYARGDRLAVASTPLGTFGLMICSDACASGQVVSRTLGMMGADIILSPCAWAVPADHDNASEPYGALWLGNYGAVARDFRIWIAGCSNVGPITAGPWRDRICIGSSLVISPDGTPALRGPYGLNAEKILSMTIKPESRPARR